jgi:hypothetical protein
MGDVPRPTEGARVVMRASVRDGRKDSTEGAWPHRGHHPAGCAAEAEPRHYQVRLVVTRRAVLLTYEQYRTYATARRLFAHYGYGTDSWGHRIGAGPDFPDSPGFSSKISTY